MHIPRIVLSGWSVNGPATRILPCCASCSMCARCCFWISCTRSRGSCCGLSPARRITSWYCSNCGPAAAAAGRVAGCAAPGSWAGALAHAASRIVRVVTPTSVRERCIPGAPSLVVGVARPMDIIPAAAEDERMNAYLLTLASATLATAASLLALAAALSLVGKLGRAGRSVIDRAARAPLLDVIVASFTCLPWLVALILGGWIGFAGALVGQFLALYAWCFAHELAHREAARGPRIVKFLNRTVGRWRNHLALLVTLIALPGFWFIRVVQIVAYWPLVALLGFPRYRQSEWVNV